MGTRNSRNQEEQSRRKLLSHPAVMGVFLLLTMLVVAVSYSSLSAIAQEEVQTRTSAETTSAVAGALQEETATDSVLARIIPNPTPIAVQPRANIYLVTQDGSGAPVGVDYATLQDAVDACIDNTPCTITTLADDLITNTMVVMPASKKITLRSASGQNHTILCTWEATNSYHLQLSGTLVLENITLEGKNISLENGNKNYRVGGIWVRTGGSLRINAGGVIRNCNSRGADVNALGAGIRMEASSLLSMYGGEISGNTAGTPGYGAGGGVFLGPYARFTMYGGKITDNKAYGHFSYDGGGGGVYMSESASFFMYDGTVSDNSSVNGYGGGVLACSSSFTMNGGVITGNSASSYGGGVALYKKSKFIMTTGDIISNRALHGGAVGVLESSFEMRNGSNLSKNTASNYGGAIYASGACTLTLTKGTISNNLAGTNGTGYGGGIMITYPTVAVMEDVNITGNTSTNLGGGLYASGGSFTVNGGRISENLSNGDGGGAYLGGGLLDLKGGSLSSNTAKGDGGGVFDRAYDGMQLINGNVYRNPVGLINSNPAPAYNNIRISNTVDVSGNVSRKTHDLPVNREYFTTRSGGSFNGDYLNNDIINYVNPHYVIRYIANNGTAQIDYWQGAAPRIGTVATAAATQAESRFTAPTGKIFAGWNTKADGAGTNYKAEQVMDISADTVLYARWVDLIMFSVTKSVADASSGYSFADKTKVFTFTLYLKDSSGTPIATGTQFAYGGSIIPGSGAEAPANGTLTIGAGGTATISLRHGQGIRVGGIIPGSSVRVVETQDTNTAGYTASFKDSDDATSTSSNDTGDRLLPATGRFFDFTNTRDTIVPAGLSNENTATSTFIALAGSASVVTLLFFTRKALCKRKAVRG